MHNGDVQSCAFIVESDDLFTSTPDSRQGPDRGQVAVLCRPVQRVRGQIFTPIISPCALIFALNDRTPSALHTAALYALFTCAKRSVSFMSSFGSISRCEHVGQLHGDGLEDGNPTAP